MNAPISSTIFLSVQRGTAPKVSLSVLLSLSFILGGVCFFLLNSWLHSSHGKQTLNDMAVLIPAGSLSTDEPEPSNSPKRGSFALNASSEGESKVENLTQTHRERVKLDFIPVQERKNRTVKGYPSVSAPDGTYGVEGHGSPDSIFCRTGEPMTAEELARLIATDSRFRPGMTVYLFCCETGKGRRPFAQKLANLLGTEVVAPTEKLWPQHSGSYIVAQERLLTSPGMIPVGIQRADVSRLGEMRTFVPDAKRSPLSKPEARVVARSSASKDLASDNRNAGNTRLASPMRKPMLRPSARTAALLAGNP